MPTYNSGQNRAAKAISGYFKKPEEDEAEDIGAEEDDDDETLAAKIAGALKRRKGG